MKSQFCLGILACAAAFAQTPKATLEGHVLNAATGEPVKKAQVMLRGADPRPDAAVYGATADAAGRFAIKDIDPGRYRLVADRNGFVSGQYGQRGAVTPGTALSLSAGQAMKDVTVKLTPQAVITGRVLDEDGEPVAYASITVWRQGYMRGKRQPIPSGGNSTNDLGEYRIFGLPPGRYYLSATTRPMGMTFAGGGATTATSDPASPEEGYVPTYYAGTTDAAAAAPIQLSPGMQARGIDLTLSKARTVRISGRVTNPPSESARRNIMISLLPREFGALAISQRVSTQVRDSSGNFMLRGVRPGSYIVSADLYEENQRLTARQPVDVGGANIEGVALALTPGVELRGSVRLEGEDAPGYEELRVFLQPREDRMMGGGGSGSVKSDGTFKIQGVAPDQYEVNVFGMRGNCYLKAVRLGDQEVTASGMDLTQGGAGELQVVISAAGGQVDGVVRNDKQEPAAGATVVLIPDEKRRERSTLYKTATTDQTGRFSLKGIVPGQYKLFSWTEVEPGAWQDPEVLKPVETRGEAVSIKENGRETVQLKVLE